GHASIPFDLSVCLGVSRSAPEASCESREMGEAGVAQAWTEDTRTALFAGYLSGSSECWREEVPNTSSQYGALIPKPFVSSWKWWRIWRSRSILPTREWGRKWWT